ncbi:MAG TPA: DUF59 domain-containing protein [Polyangiaceae bacterium LLY-WYZ-14_1]|nr:DUF59 domain-containing protein [Polyangiaceae bacterium LLY-WYZ-14_1]
MTTHPGDQSDIEHLKVHKIGPRDTQDRLRLPQIGPTGLPMNPRPADEIDEAYGGSGTTEGTVPRVEPGELRDRIVAALKTVHDPEIPVNIYDLGLIYGFDVEPDGRVELEMTLTAPACPVAGQLVQEVADKVGQVDGVAVSHVRLTWDPPWTKDRMTEEAMLELGLL